MRRFLAMCVASAVVLLPCVGDAAGSSDTTGAGERGVAAVGGALVGVPSGMALIGGVAAGPLSLKVSGGYWGRNWNGIQADLGWTFDPEGLLTQGIFLVGGTYRVNPRLLNDQGDPVSTLRQDHYLGLAYEADYSGFFLQAGLAKGWGDYPNPEVVLQAGYLITFP